MQDDFRSVLDFWFRELEPAQWYGGGRKLDDLIRERFGSMLEHAIAGELDAWAGTAHGRLALIIVLDQFARQAYRGLASAFDGAARAESLVVDGIDRKMDAELTVPERQFFYMPLMHAEDMALQDLSIRMFSSDKALADRVLNYARSHRDTIVKFGRFPYRNEALGRESTPDEIAYLEAQDD